MPTGLEAGAGAGWRLAKVGNGVDYNSVNNKKNEKNFQWHWHKDRHVDQIKQNRGEKQCVYK